ncbi:hypothetical protein MVEG_07985 [Podila verticillata NRRL 6337]|nr:hypothetical protein MVEG_07985 [Podila verticillata NRRL 6337]
MVRLSLSLLATAFAAVASAAPLFAQQSFKKITSDPRCLPGTSIKEYQSFELLSHELDTYVSRKIDGSRLVGGVNGDKNLQKLEFCIVSSDRHHCDSIWGTACILENVDYRIRVKGRDKAYLRVDGHYVDVVSSFEDASPLSLSNDNGLGVRIAHQYEDGDKNVFATSVAFEEGKPIVLEYPQKNRKRQRFEIIEPSKGMKTVDNIKCIPQISIKEYEAFELYSYNLDSFVSKKFNQDVLVGGIFGSKLLQQLQFCIVSTDTECNPAYPTNCIYENTQYRYRVHGPEKGYLRVQNGLVRIVPDFEDGTLLTMLWDENRGVRIAKRNKGSVSVLATTRPGEHLTLEGENKPTDSQFFALATINKPLGNLEKAISPGKCLLDTRFKEGERFAIGSRGSRSLVSTLRETSVLLAGVFGNPEYHQLEFSVIRHDREDMIQGPGDCIYEDTLYVFQVYDHGHQVGYLRAERDFLQIVPNFGELTPLYFRQSSSGGLRIDQSTSDGPRVVTTVEPGMPLTFATPKSGVDHQVFDLITMLRDINEKIEPHKCLPDNYAREFQPFVVRNHQFDGFLSKLSNSNYVIGGEMHNRDSKPLKFVVGSYDQDDLKAPGDCIQEDFEYKFEVIEPQQGFLRLEGQRLIVVESEKDATLLYFHKSASQGVRIAQKTPIGPMAVAVTFPGGPTTLERPESKNERQVFDLLTTVPSSDKHALW